MTRRFFANNTRTLVLALFLGLPAVAAARGRPLEFRVTYDQKVTAAPFTGRVFVVLSRGSIPDIVRGADWFNPAPFLARDVRAWVPGQVTVLGADGLAFPVPLSGVKKGTFWVQAIMDFGLGQNFGAAEGNGYSRAHRLELDPASSGPVDLYIDQVYHERHFPETDRIKLVDIESRKLSSFHGRAVHMRAAVLLPSSYHREPVRRYPVIYVIPGFGGTHQMAPRFAAQNITDVAGTDMLVVVLDPSCPLGHHVFADSENNGPWGRALLTELIPTIETTFHGLGVPGARFVTGHSSGGWSSLWLQVAYPDFFGGVWSTSPDPVDFRDFQQINLYAPGVNMFRDGAGKPRPVARLGNRPVLFYQKFSDMEVVMGHGGQLSSFEAVFGPRGPDGQPTPLWDRKTGQVDPGVAASWQRYDLRLVLERNWKTRGPQLAGKMHVYTGGADTFYLEGAVKLLKASLAQLGSDAVVEVIPGRNHGNLLDTAMRQRIAREMAQQFRRNLPGRLRAS